MFRNQDAAFVYLLLVRPGAYGASQGPSRSGKVPNARGIEDGARTTSAGVRKSTSQARRALAALRAKTCPRKIEETS